MRDDGFSFLFLSLRRVSHCHSGRSFTHTHTHDSIRLTDSLRHTLVELWIGAGKAIGKKYIYYIYSVQEEMDNNQLLGFFYFSFYYFLSLLINIFDWRDIGCVINDGLDG